ncbi:MAG: hypothetical protein QXM43_00250 [Desulfurococcaceae archaeon]
MPSRVVEAALILSVSLAATIIAFITLTPYLFPQRALSAEALRDNVETFAALLDRGAGKLRLQAKYSVQHSGYSLRVTLRVFEESRDPIWSYEHRLTVPVVYTPLERAQETTLIRGEPSPYSTTGSALIVAEGYALKIVMRPRVQVEDCNYYGLKCKSVTISFPRLYVAAGGKVYESSVLTAGQVVDIYINKSQVLPQEIKYGLKLEITFELLPPGSESAWELVGFPMSRKISLELDEYGVFLVQYIVNDIVIKA